MIREGWTGTEFDVLPAMDESTIKAHMTDWHGWVPVRRDYVDRRPNAELLARHDSMHTGYRDGLVDAHFHEGIEPRWVAPRGQDVEVQVSGTDSLMVTEEAFIDRSAESISEHFERMVEEWRLIMVRAEHDADPRRAERHARRFVLVNIFGTPEQFHMDPEFHAKVCLAEQMMVQASHALGRGDR